MTSRFGNYTPSVPLDMMLRFQLDLKRPHFLKKRFEIFRSQDHVLTVVQVSCLRNTVIVIVVRLLL
jgi:hypothetical protein